jgi:hypothetical protein
MKGLEAMTAKKKTSTKKAAKGKPADRQRAEQIVKTNRHGDRVSAALTKALDMDAAALLSAVIKCPDLPERLRYELANVVTDELTNKVDTDAPEILRAMLEQYAKGGA